MHFGLALLLCLTSGSQASPEERSQTLIVCDDPSDAFLADPQKEFDASNHVILQQIFEGLVRLDPDGRLEPGLATEWRRLDDLTLELKLRSGVRFHDGEPCDAQTVKFSIERYLDPRTGFPGIGYLNSIDRVEVPDPTTLRIRTKFPDGILLHRLAAFVLISPRRYYATKGQTGYDEHPIGTGPFRFVRHDAGRELVLEENPDYWRGAPKFKRLVFKFLPFEGQVEQLLKGQVDIVTDLPGTDTLRVTKSRLARIVKKECHLTCASTFSRSGPLADKRVRQALNYAVNRDDLIRYDLMGNGRPLASLTMAGEVGHDASLRAYPHDPERARRLLREAGFPDGLHLRTLYNASRVGARTVGMISQQLGEVGVTLDLSSTTDSHAVSDQRALNADLGFSFVPDAMAHSFFVQSIALFSLSPFSLLKDKNYDRLLQKMVMTLDPKEQDRAGRELDRYVHDEALSIFTYQKIRTYGVSRKVHFIASVTGMPYFSLSSPEPIE